MTGVLEEHVASKVTLVRSAHRGEHVLIAVLVDVTKSDTMPFFDQAEAT